MQFFVLSQESADVNCQSWSFANSPRVSSNRRRGALQEKSLRGHQQWCIRAVIAAFTGPARRAEGLADYNIVTGIGCLAAGRCWVQEWQYRHDCSQIVRFVLEALQQRCDCLVLMAT
jgi:hypothetical protein